ncbi:hypothetical protein CFC21_088712, partial [Triticum aestivum]
QVGHIHDAGEPAGQLRAGG